MHRATIAVTGGRPDRSPDAPLNEPVDFASALVAGGAVEYTRHDARNSRAFEAVLGALEGGTAVLLSSGMAAVTAVLEVVAPDSVARPPVMYSGTGAALDSRSAITQSTCRGADEYAAAGCDLKWLESPSNPDLRVVDIRKASAGTGTTVADNTFATPLGQRPLALGADLVVHSVSKYLAGHSDVILGAVVCADDGLAAAFREYREIAGAIAGPMEAWLALRGMRTLDVRLRRAAANAQILAGRLTGHPGVQTVVWPGLTTHPDHEIAMDQMDVIGPIISIVPVGGADAADQICGRTRIWTHATSLGGVESTLERRRRHDFESDLVDPALLRLSVGIEDVEDLWKDLDQALKG
ncbi:MAG: PLP-dependent aspartate aminotransferase family protein [Candidatus Nanopelagicales bacterium]